VIRHFDPALAVFVGSIKAFAMTVL